MDRWTAAGEIRARRQAALTISPCRYRPIMIIIGLYIGAETSMPPCLKVRTHRPRNATAPASGSRDRAARSSGLLPGGKCRGRRKPYFPGFPDRVASALRDLAAAVVPCGEKKFFPVIFPVLRENRGPKKYPSGDVRNADFRRRAAGRARASTPRPARPAPDRSSAPARASAPPLPGSSPCALRSPRPGRVRSCRRQSSGSGDG
jgi:hypothetical protein